jgi:hypothetical protein
MGVAAVISSRAKRGLVPRRVGHDAERFGIGRAQPLELAVGAVQFVAGVPGIAAAVGERRPRGRGDVGGGGERILPGPIAGVCVRDANQCHLVGRL